MGEQRLHSALAPVDILTRLEHEQVMHKAFDDALRARYRGIDAQRFPRVLATASGTTLNLFASPNEMPCGPGQGDFWVVRRIIVKSSVLADTAKYQLYRGSSPSDVTSAYGMTNLLDVGVGGATPGINVNVAYYIATNALFLEPGEQIYAALTSTTSGNQYQLDGEAIRVPAEMKGKLLA